MNPDDIDAELLAIGGRLRAVEETVDQLHHMAEELRDERKALVPFHWPDLDDDRRQERWTAFLGWMQNVAVSRYPAVVTALEPCWWQHEDVVDALTAAWLTWLEAYRNGNAAATDMGNWQRTYLPDMLNLAKKALATCTRGHEPQASTPPATLSTVPTAPPTSA